MTTKYTPGPWKANLAVISNAPSQYVITNGKWGAPNIAIVVDDNAANARLIAAAPEMLECIRRIVQSAPFTGLPLGLEKDIQEACTLLNRIRV